MRTPTRTAATLAVACALSAGLPASTLAQGAGATPVTSSYFVRDKIAAGHAFVSGGV